MELVNITSQIPESEPKLRIYPNYAVLNAAAVSLLDLRHGDYVQFACPKIDRGNGRPELYLRKTTRILGSVSVRARGNTMILGSRKLAASLVDKLNGKGCYLISPDVTIDDKDGKYYNVFFRNYGN